MVLDEEEGAGMDDEKIIQLYWDRDEQAIPVTDIKYGAYCTSIAKNILGSNEDAEECVNDTYLNAWNAMPPHRPAVLSAFLGKITRNISLNRYKYNTAEKRGGGQCNLVFEELSDFISDKDNVEQEIDRKELINTINEFLAALPQNNRNIFVCRYWYFDSISEIGKHFHMTENNVSVTLSRMRLKLRNYLSERGYEL